jgi:Family of unknown function (DUF5681)
MSKKDSSQYAVGYKKPPRHTRFKPGQSGNVSGRAKKIRTPDEVVEEEFRTPVTTVDASGKRRKISMWRAIVKRCNALAAQGDLKATALVLKLPRPQRSGEGDSLPPILQELRAINARHEAATQNGTTPKDNDEPAAQTEGWQEEGQ